MTNHIKTRRNLREVKTVNEFENLLKRYVLTDEEKRILRLHYVNGKSLTYIGDMLGYSESSIKRKHNQILKKMN